MDDFEKELKSHTSGMDLLFGKPYDGLEFIKPDLDFEINPDHFMRWLEMEFKDEPLMGDYQTDCASMCEYACLFVGMLLHEKELKGEMEIMYGKFGFWEHYWLRYTLDGEAYFLDLTLKQFVKDAPKFSVVKAVNKRVNGCYSYIDDEDDEGIPIKQYVEDKDAFAFYNNPNYL